MVFTKPPEFWCSLDNGHSLVINLIQGVDHEILPCGQGRIDTVNLTSCKVQSAPADADAVAVNLTSV